MENKIEIKQDYKLVTLPFAKNRRSLHFPYVDIVVKDIHSERDTPAREFIVDTGASISILNSKYEDFLKDLPVLDHIWIQYGDGKPKELKVYKVCFIIKGKEFLINAAYNENSPLLLLGHLDFFENLSFVVFNSKEKQVKMIKL